ncbi:MAG: DUF4142 domain-containing protein [Gammaproteobacteria bacterium]
MKNVSKVLTSSALAACLALPFGAHAADMNTPAASALNKADQKILQEMAVANIDEIAAAKIAVNKSQSAEVKAFAQQMIDDHTKALNDVTTLAQTKGVTLPTEPDTKHKAAAAALEKLSGAAFDKAYMMQAGVGDHNAVQKKLQKNQTKAKDADVKALAAKMLPTVEQHLHSAHQLRDAQKAAK